MSVTELKLQGTDFVVIVCQVQVKKPASEVWSHVGDFEKAGQFLNVPCELVSDTEGIGTVRRVGDSILEVMVGETDLSYSYAQIVGPLSHLDYHGCVSAVAIESTSSMLVYSITYNQNLLDKDARRTQSDHIRQRFQGAVEAMKLRAEATLL